MKEIKKEKLVSAIVSATIHRQCFHQQREMTALVIKEFMWVIRKHGAKLNNPFKATDIKNLL